MTLRDSLMATLVAAVWGFNFVVIDWGMAGVPPLLFVALRFALVVFPAILLVPRPTAPLRVVAMVGVFMSLGQFGLLYTSMHLGMPPGLAALVLQAQVIFTVLIAAAWSRETPSRMQVVGIAIGAGGLVVVGLGRGGHITLAALLLCVAAALSWGIGNVVARRAGVASGLSLVVWSAVFVPVPLVLLSLGLDGPARVVDGLAGIGWPGVLSTLYTVVLASLFGYSVFNGLLARHHASSVVPFVLLAPPVAMLSAWLLLGEVPNTAESVGGLLVLVGVAVTLVRRTSRLTSRRTSRGAVGEDPGRPADPDARLAGDRDVDPEQAGPPEVVALVDEQVGR